MDVMTGDLHLAEITEPSTYTVSTVQGRYCSRLMEMGIIPGAHVTFVRSAPFRFPIEVEVNGLLLVLRKEEASGVRLMH
jgi:Fe2+ transport system protein FeoA